MKRKGSASTSSPSSGHGESKTSKRSKEKDAISRKPPPSPAAKVLISRALRKGRSASPKQKNSSRLQMDLTGDSSMMSNADSTLDTSNLRKVLDKTNWWKNIDESMLNIPTADLTAGKNNESILENSIVKSPAEKKKRKARRVSKSAFVQAVGVETPESPSRKSQTYTGKNVSTRSSVASDKADEDPPSPQEQQKPSVTRRQTRRISLNTFHKEMGTTRQSSYGSSDTASSKTSEASDNADDDPPSPQEQQKPRPTQRHTRRISLNTFHKEMGTTRQSSYGTSDAVSSKTSEASDIADDDPPSPHVQTKSRPFKRQTRRISYSTFQREMGPYQDVKSPKKIYKNSDPITEDVDSPLMAKVTTPKKKHHAMKKVNASVFQEAMKDTLVQESPQSMDEATSPETSVDEIFKEQLLDTSSKKKNRTANSVSFETFVSEFEPTTPSPPKEKYTSFSSSDSDSDSITQSTSLQRENTNRHHKKVSLDGFKKLLGPVNESDSPLPTTSSADLDDDSDTMTPLALEKKRQLKRTSSGKFEKIMNEMSSSHVTITTILEDQESEFLTEHTIKQKDAALKHSRRNENEQISGPVASSAVSRHSMATIPEGEMLNDIHDTEKKTSLRSKKISFNTFTEAMDLDSEEDTEQSNRQELDVSKAPGVERKSIVSRDSLSAFARKGPVRHSESPSSPRSKLSRSKLNLSNMEQSAIHHTASSPQTSILNYSKSSAKNAPKSPNSKVLQVSFSSPDKFGNSSQDSAVSMEEILSPELNKNKAKQPQSRVSVGTFMNIMDTVSPSVSPEKASAQRVTRKSTQSTNTDSLNENKVSKSPQHSPSINPNQSNQNSLHSTSGESSKSASDNLTNILKKKLSLVLTRVDDSSMVIEPKEIDSEKNTSYNVLHAKKSTSTGEFANRISEASPENQQVNTSSRFPPDHFTAADFHNALSLLEKENEHRLDDSEEEEEPQQHSKKQSIKKKFSLSDFQRAMEDIDIGESNATLHDITASLATNDSVRSSLRKSTRETVTLEPKNSPRKRKDTDMSTASPRKSSRLSATGHEETDMSISSPRKSSRLSTHEATGILNLNTPTISSPRKSQTIKSTTMEISATKSPNKDTYVSGISKNNAYLKVTPQLPELNSVWEKHTPVRYSLPPKGSNMTRKSAVRKRYTLIDFQRAMETVRSPSFTSDSPSVPTRRSSISKFSINDFEKAITTLKTDDINNSHDSSSASYRNSSNSLSKRASNLLEITNTSTATNNSNAEGKKILQSKDPETSKLSLRSGKSVSLSKQQDPETLSLRSGKSVSLSKQQDPETLSFRSGKSVSPSKQQDPETSKLSLRSGKSVSPSKQQDPETSKLSLRSGKSVSPSKQQDPETLSLRSGKPVSPSKQQDPETLSLRSGKSVSPSKQQDPETLSLRSGKPVSPSKQQDPETLSLRSGKSVSPSKQQDPETLSLRSGKPVSPSKQQDPETLSLRSGKSVSPSKQQDLEISNVSKQSKILSPRKFLSFSEHPESQSTNDSSDVSELSVFEEKTRSKRKSTKVFTLEDFQNAMATAISPTKSSKSNSSLDSSLTGSSSNKSAKRSVKLVGLSDFQKALLEARSPSMTEAASIIQAGQAKNDAISSSVDDITSTKMKKLSAAGVVSLFQEAVDEIEDEEIGTEANYVEENVNDDNVTADQNTSIETNRQSKQNANISSVSTVITPSAKKSLRSSIISIDKLEIIQSNTTSSTMPSKSLNASNLANIENMETLNIDSPAKNLSQLTEKETSNASKHTSQNDEDMESPSDEDSTEEDFNLSTNEKKQEEKETQPPDDSSSSESEEEIIDQQSDIENNSNKSPSIIHSEDTEKALESDNDSLHSESSHNEFEEQQDLSGMFSAQSSINMNQSENQEKKNSVCKNLSNAFSATTSLKRPSKQDLKTLQDALKNAASTVKYSSKNVNTSKAARKILKNIPLIEKKKPPKNVPYERILNGKLYRKPRLKRPKSWVNDRLYKYLENHFSKKSAFKARVMSEEFVVELVEKVTSTINSKTKAIESAAKVARLVKKAGLVQDNYDFFCFCKDYLPEAFHFKAFPYNEGKGVNYLDD